MTLLLSLVLATAALADTPAAPRRIALSFDDAPRADGSLLSGQQRTHRLIDGLQRAGVEGALFFVTTGHLDRQAGGEQRLRDYVAAGHRLANHSHAHPGLSRSDVDDYLADLDQARTRLAGLPGVLPLFRFPFLDEGRDLQRRDALRAALAERGLHNGYVTVDNYDWYLDSLASRAQSAGHELELPALGKLYVEILLDAVEFYDAIARRTLGRSPAHVLLLHENDLAALFIEDLVAALRAGGWAIIPAEEAYRDPIAALQPDTLFLGQGRVAALAHLAGERPSTLVHRWEDESALQRRFDAEVLGVTDSGRALP